METKFKKGTPIAVSAPAEMTMEQTLDLTKKLLHLAGCTGCRSGFQFFFTEESQAIGAAINERGEVSVSAINQAF